MVLEAVSVSGGVADTTVINGIRWVLDSNFVIVSIAVLGADMGSDSVDNALAALIDSRVSTPNSIAVLDTGASNTSQETVATMIDVMGRSLGARNVPGSTTILDAVRVGGSSYQTFIALVALVGRGTTRVIDVSTISEIGRAHV